MVNADEIWVGHKDHGKLGDIDSSDHHPTPAHGFVNDITTVISGLSNFNLDISLPDFNYTWAQVTLRQTWDALSGKTWTFAIFTDNPGRTIAVSQNVPGGDYYSFYVLAYAKLNGDTILTQPSSFGDSIRLRDSQLITIGNPNNNIRLSFENQAVIAKTLTVTGHWMAR